MHGVGIPIIACCSELLYISVQLIMSLGFFGFLFISGFGESKFHFQMSASHMKGASQRHSGAKSTTNWFSKKLLNTLEV